MPFVPALPLSALPEGDRVGIRLGGHEIVLFRVDGRIHAFEDRCPHLGARLSEVGHVRAGTVICVLHCAKFDLETGRVLAIPAEEDLVRFATRVVGGTIEIELGD
ncbi:MAG: Rieske (2Fe-2S) protein [Acidobacteriota bacterium]